MGDAQTILAVSVPTLAVLIGILVNNARLTDTNSVSTTCGHQIVGTRDLLRAELIRVEQVMDARLKHIEESR